MRVAARELAEEFEIEPEFKSVESIRPRRKKRHFSYEHQDEPPITEEKNFEVNVCNFLVDVTLNSIEERFFQLQKHKNFQFLYNVFDLKNMTDSQVIAILCIWQLKIVILMPQN